MVVLLVVVILQLNLNVFAQILSLDSCISMALRENRQLQISKHNAEIATNTRKAARTKYLPQVNLVATYMHTGDEVQLLNDDIQSALGNLGTGTLTGMQQKLMSGDPLIQKVMTTAAQLGFDQQAMGAIAKMMDAKGQAIADAFRTDTRNMFGATVQLTQPIYMGGKILAGNKMADLAEEIAELKYQKAEEEVRLDVEKTYYLVVEVEHKKKLATEYVALIQKLSNDVDTMIASGVATKADGLKVSVKLNEAEMQLLQAENGLALSKMLLCKQIGLALDTPIEVDTTVGSAGTVENRQNNRKELQMLGKAVSLYDAKVKSIRSAHLPTLAFTGGYMISNPNVFNGFEKKFKGTWNVGLVLNMHLWDWNETSHKVRSAKAEKAISQLQLDEAQQLIYLQIQQSEFKFAAAQRRLQMTEKNLENANENLRCATLGFEEGVMTTTDVMMAQTAWLQAKTQNIEAQIGLITAKLTVRNSYGN